MDILSWNIQSLKSKWAFWWWKIHLLVCKWPFCHKKFNHWRVNGHFDSERSIYSSVNGQNGRPWSKNFFVIGLLGRLWFTYSRGIALCFAPWCNPFSVFGRCTCWRSASCAVSGSWVVGCSICWSGKWRFLVKIFIYEAVNGSSNGRTPLCFPVGQLCSCVGVASAFLWAGLLGKASKS